MAKHGVLSRRQFLKVGCRVLVGGLIVTVASPLYARFAEPRWLQVVHTTVLIPNLPPAHDGLIIGQLSDLHVGSEKDATLVREAVRLLNAVSPDLVALTGDFVTGDAAHSVQAADALTDLWAPHGVYAVLGNHDVWTDAGRVADALAQVDITVLRDDRLRLNIQGAPLWLLGIEDRAYTGISSVRDTGNFATFQYKWRGTKQAMTSLLADVPPEDPRLLLVHNPDFTEMLPQGRIDLALSGHTHGGQVRIPLLGAPFVPSCFGPTFVGGLVKGTHTHVYVSRGVGAIPPAVRFNCRPEVTVLRLGVSPA